MEQDRVDWQDWLERAKRRWWISPDGDGYLEGEQEAADRPSCVRFWQDCEEVLRRHQREPNAAESAFVFEKLLTLQARRGHAQELYFAATDGSRAQDAGGNPLVARGVILHDGRAARTFGGRMQAEADGFQRHSYEAEVQAFDDMLEVLPDGAVLVVVTDCLSGVAAVGAARRRTNAQQAGKYRAKEVNALERKEQRMKEIHWVWVHSHVGITVNEAIDAEIDELSDAWNEPRPPQCLFQSFEVRGVKRSLGQYVFDSFTYLALAELAGHSKHTFKPDAGTWAAFRDAQALRLKLFSRHEVDCFQDLREDRAGLLHECSWIPTVKGNLTYYKRRALLAKQEAVAPTCSSAGNGCRIRCCCGAVGKQDRWHAVFECPGTKGELPLYRTKALAWLDSHVELTRQHDVLQATRALRGEGKDMNTKERELALRFMLAMPTSPEEDSDDTILARGMAKAVQAQAIRCYEDVKAGNQILALGDGGKAWRTSGSRLTWWEACGYIERWRVITTARKCLYALRTQVFIRGPKRSPKAQPPPRGTGTQTSIDEWMGSGPRVQMNEHVMSAAVARARAAARHFEMAGEATAAAQGLIQRTQLSIQTLREAVATATEFMRTAERVAECGNRGYTSIQELTTGGALNMMAQISEQAYAEWRQRELAASHLRKLLERTGEKAKALTHDLRAACSPAMVQEIIDRMEADSKAIVAAMLAEAGDEAMADRWQLILKAASGSVDIATEAALHVTASEWEGVTVRFALEKPMAIMVGDKVELDLEATYDDGQSHAVRCEVGGERAVVGRTHPDDSFKLAEFEIEEGNNRISSLKLNGWSTCTVTCRLLDPTMPGASETKRAAAALYKAYQMLKDDAATATKADDTTCARDETIEEALAQLKEAASLAGRVLDTSREGAERRVEPKESDYVRANQSRLEARGEDGEKLLTLVAPAAVNNFRAGDVNLSKWWLQLVVLEWSKCVRAQDGGGREGRKRRALRMVLLGKAEGRQLLSSHEHKAAKKRREKEEEEARAWEEGEKRWREARETQPDIAMEVIKEGRPQQQTIVVTATAARRRRAAPRRRDKREAVEARREMQRRARARWIELHKGVVARRRRMRQAESAVKRLERSSKIGKGVAEVVRTREFRAAWANRQVWWEAVRRREHSRGTQDVATETNEEAIWRATISAAGRARQARADNARRARRDEASARARHYASTLSVSQGGARQRAYELAALARAVGEGTEPPLGRAGIL